MNSKFIVFEGLDGAGKTTQLEKLVEYLEAKDISIWRTKEPTYDEPYGARIIRIVRMEEPGLPAAELQTLYIKDREKHSREILEHLEKGEWVICDRYWYSTVAYGVSEGLDFDEWVEKNRRFPAPDLALYFDVPAEEAMARIEKRGLDKRYFEKLEKLKKVREVYLKLVEVRPEFYLVDNTSPPDEVFKEVLKLIEPLL